MPYDLSKGVQNQNGFVSFFEHPFIPEVQHFKVWRTHSTH